MQETVVKVQTARGECEWIERPTAEFLSQCLGAGVIPFFGDQVIMVRNHTRGWEFPGGKIRAEESVEECARREAREEAGIELRGMQLLGGSRQVFSGGKVEQVAYFTAEADRAGTPASGETETKARHWEQLLGELSFSDDLARLLFETARRRAGRIPRWAKSSSPVERGASGTQQVLTRERLHTVCRSAACPNRGECYARGTATFLILGDRCTRNCRFCAVEGGAPVPPDPDEPERLASAAQQLGLKFVVITSVTRDDLPDGGASHFARCIQAIRACGSDVRVEVLTPDFGGDAHSLDTVLAAAPDVFNHNVETVPRLYDRVRPEASYRRSLQVLERAARSGGRSAVKSGLMVGLGETPAEVVAVLRDLRDAGCQMVTIGQYLRPSPGHLEVSEYVSPARFDDYRIEGEKLGLGAVISGPLVRSSYHAAEAARTCGLG